MFYTVYKITNQINNKFYIGKHQTGDLDDGYMGSGKLLKKAFAKYGITNFKKEILFIFDNEMEMNAKEKELVVISEESYNLCPGGKGGFGYINSNVETRIAKNKKARMIANQNGALDKAKIALEILRTDETWCEKKYKKWKETINKNHPTGIKSFLGKKHSDKWKQDHSNKMKNKQQGILNSQFGTCWVYNEKENKKISKDELDHYLKLGYTLGRKIKRV